MNKERFVKIIAENRKLIYKICNSYCPHPDDRRDLEQEILLQIWNSLKRFDGRVKPSTWVYRVALNTAMNFHRNNYKHHRRHAQFDASVFSLPDLEYDPTKDKQIAMLHDFIAKLDGVNKALMLLYLDDKRYREIGEILGISESNVAVKISRIKKQLRKKVEKLND